MDRQYNILSMTLFMSENLSMCSIYASKAKHYTGTKAGAGKA